MSELRYVENDNKGFNIMDGENKIGEISYALILALAPLASNRAGRFGITNDEVMAEIWNYSTRLM